jgi:hypothetical protein
MLKDKTFWIGFIVGLVALYVYQTKLKGKGMGA